MVVIQLVPPSLHYWIRDAQLIPSSLHYWIREDQEKHCAVYLEGIACIFQSGSQFALLFRLAPSVGSRTLIFDSESVVTQLVWVGCLGPRLDISLVSLHLEVHQSSVWLVHSSRASILCPLSSRGTEQPLGRILSTQTNVL